MVQRRLQGKVAIITGGATGVLDQVMGWDVPSSQFSPPFGDTTVISGFEGPPPS